ncbi:hypothetical protein [Cellulomonas hominis]|uniref:hypothetical protein n=1 Tax=Cellulomonas hominis TaxID=156981 RepID=UPI001BCCA320|nr:hypothetical protein [Cellulomonas hominis]
MTADAQGQPAWELADAWVLASVERGCSSTDLTRLLAAADRLHHAIPEHDEVARGVGRLAASGLLEVTAQHLAPTPAGAEVLRRGTGAGDDLVLSLLDALRPVPLVEGVWAVPPGAIEAGHRRYTHPLTWWLPPRRRRYSSRGRH